MNLGIAPKPVSKRVCCRLCICEGVDGTMLCREHLEGYMFAVAKLKSAAPRVAHDLIAAIRHNDNDAASAWTSFMLKHEE